MIDFSASVAGFGYPDAMGGGPRPASGENPWAEPHHRVILCTEPAAGTKLRGVQG
jgi:hypothetical protein